MPVCKFSDALVASKTGQLAAARLSTPYDRDGPNAKKLLVTDKSSHLSGESSIVLLCAVTDARKLAAGRGLNGVWAARRTQIWDL